MYGGCRKDRHFNRARPCGGSNGGGFKRHIPAATGCSARLSLYIGADAAGVAVPAVRVIDGADLVPFVTGARDGGLHDALLGARARVHSGAAAFSSSSSCARLTRRR